MEKMIFLGTSLGGLATEGLRSSRHNLCRDLRKQSKLALFFGPGKNFLET